MRYHIEAAKYQYGILTVTGWAVGKRPEDAVGITVQINGRNEENVRIDRQERSDIRDVLFPGSSCVNFGFRIKFKVDKSKKVRILFRSGGHTRRLSLNLPRIQLGFPVLDQDFKSRLRRLIKGEADEELPPAKPDRDPELMDCGPIISILVPVYRTDEIHFREMVESVKGQYYRSWELLLADGSEMPEGQMSGPERVIKSMEPDSRIHYIKLPKNLGISGNTNEALKAARGFFVAMLDHDDVLHPEALSRVGAAIIERPGGDFFYTDHDLTDEDGMRFFNPLRKPAWSPEMMYSANYITHFAVVRKELLEAIGGFDSSTDGAQDWDMFLKASERTKRIFSIPRVLYHWRVASTSSALSVEQTKPYALDAQIRAIQNHLDRRHEAAKAYFWDKKSYTIRVEWENKEDPSDPVYIITNSWCKEISEESKKELAMWAIQGKIGLVMPKLLYEDGRVASLGVMGEKEGKLCSLGDGMKDHTADIYGHTDWYRNPDFVEPACFAVVRSLANRIGITPDVCVEDFGTLAEITERVRRLDLRMLTVPFATAVVTKNLEKAIEERNG